MIAEAVFGNATGAALIEDRCRKNSIPKPAKLAPTQRLADCYDSQVCVAYGQNAQLIIARARARRGNGALMKRHGGSRDGGFRRRVYHPWL